jgi:AcrR family transcriptional regulator
LSTEVENVDETILDAAMTAFAEHGFHETTVAAIADRAGVGKGTVYRHFGKKNRLFAALLKRGTSQLKDSIEQVYETTSDPIEQIEGIYRAHLDLFDRARPLMEIIVNEGLAQTGDQKSEVIEEFSSYRTLVTEAFEAGVKQNIFRQDPPEKLSRLFLSWIWGMLRSSVIFSEPDPETRFGDLLIDMFTKGLKEDS